jgi:hypothetical protein
MRIPQTISGLLVHIIGDALGYRPAGSSEGKGVERARKRLAEKRKRNQEVYGHLSPAEPSRQVLRADTRRALKTFRSIQKESAMKNKLLGGAAVVQ